VSTVATEEIDAAAAGEPLPVDDSPVGDGPVEATPPGGGFGSPVAKRVYDLLAPVVATVDAELFDVEWAGGTLRVVADRPDGITTDGLAQINRLVSPILDQHDPVPGRYTLEVSSPGVERPLRRPDHYRRAVGETVIVKAIPGIDPRRVRGLLRSFDGDTLTIEVDEIDGVELDEVEEHRLSMDDIDSARTHFEWGPKPKPGSPEARKGKARGGAGGRGRSGGKGADRKPGNDEKRTTEEERGHE
jgi:ribosome maturation factor RimP